MQHHYTYQLTSNFGHKYIGVRSSDVLPEVDEYLGSSKVVADLIEYGVWFRKEILGVWGTREKALQHEIELHELYDVGKNPEFLNLANQTSTGFDIQGNEEVGKKITAALADPDVKEKLSASQKIAQNRPEVKEKRSASMKIALNRPEVKEKMSASVKIAWADPEVKEKMSASVKIAWADPEVKEKRSASQKIAQNRPEVKEKRSASMKIALNRPEVKEKRSASMKIALNRPEVKEKRSASQKIAQKIAKNRPEARAKNSAAQKEVFRLKNLCCQELGITSPGISYCNLPRHVFEEWLLTHNAND